MEPSLLLLLFSLTPSLFLLSLAALKEDANTSTLTDPKEAEAIRVIYQKWNIQDWKLYYDKGDVDPCNITGTDVNTTPLPHLICASCTPNQTNSCHITSLILSGLNISAEIPRELFGLTMLTHMDLSKNLLYGPVPPQIGSLSNLQYLDLSINLLNGSVPTEFNNLNKLTHLNFGSNNFSGSFPSLENLSSLQELRFDSSGLSGHINNGFRSLTALQVLWAFDNDINGTLDQLFLHNLISLTELKIYGTFFQGPIPAEFQELKSLKTLIIGDLIDASTNGALNPDSQTNPPNSNFSFLNNMTNLQTLSLRNCSLKGTNFLDDIKQLQNLAFLDLSFNSLSGTINSSFVKKFPQLKQLYLGGGNKFSGDISQFVPSHTKIDDLDISFNPISGSFTQPPDMPHINYLGSSINVQSGYNYDSNVRQILQNIKTNSSEDVTRPSPNYIAIKCGGDVHNSSSKNISFFNSDVNSQLGSADLRVDTNNQWVVSNIAPFPTSKSIASYEYTVSTTSTISETNPVFIPLYQTARRSQSSLGYYIVGLPNADNYTVELHFAEIIIGDPTTSWQGLGKRYFNILVQDEATRDFNIVDQAGGFNRACNKTYHNVTVKNGYIYIQLVWNGRGTCCIPDEGTYGPLISAIHIYQGYTAPPIPIDTTFPSKRKTSKKAGVVVGILSLCIASVMITSSVVFLWWEWIQIGQEMKY